MTLADRFFAFDDELARHGVKPCSRWWRDGVRTWLDDYERGGALELWAAVGRGAAKSTLLYKLALFFALFGEFEIPPGERHLAVVLSRLKEEAAKGIAIIGRWLDLLEVRHKVAGDVIELAGRPTGIRVVAASVAAASGWRAFFIGCDEFSKWATGGVDQLDANEVRSSAIAMTATHARAPVVTVGSAWGAFGEFFDTISAGTTPTRVVMGPAATWEAAPHITREECLAKEPDKRRFAREYECRFQGSALAAFEEADVERAFVSTLTNTHEVRGRVLVIDASSGKKDTWSYAIVERVVDGGRELVCMTLVDGIAGRFYNADAGEQVVTKVAGVAKKHGVTRVYGDQRESLMLASAFSRHGLRFVEMPWSAPAKVEAVERVRRWLADGTIGICRHETMRREMLSFEERLTPAGAFTFGARGTGHDDYVALLITAAMVEIAGGLRAKPTSGGKAPTLEIGAPILDRAIGFGDDERVPGMDSATADWFRNNVR